MFPYLAVASGLFLVGDRIYHHYYDEEDHKLIPPRELTVPRIAAGDPIPLIYGRCLVRTPVVADLRVVNATVGSGSDVTLVDMLLIVGVPMDEGRGSNGVLDMYAGDKRATSTENVNSDGKWAQSGIGGPEVPVRVTIEDAGDGYAEVLNGNPNQVLANDGDTEAVPPLPTVPQLSPTYAGRRMLTPSTPTPARLVQEIPGYRGYLSVFLFYPGDGNGWSIGNQGSIPPYSFEAASFPASTSGYPAIGPTRFVRTFDANPADVIWDLLVSKLGISSTYLDLASFRACATTLWQEGNGYSRAIEEDREIGDLIVEVLRQINGCIYGHPSTGKLHMKLIRADYDPTKIVQITRQNAELQGFAAGGWQGLPNAIRVTFANRDLDYAEDSRVEQNQANAVGQDGHARWQVLSFPGVTNGDQAQEIAARELYARSNPLMKCRAICDRSVVLMPGDPVRVTWSKPDIADIVFRVASVSGGTIMDGAFAYDLIQDTAYVYRNRPAVPRSPKLPLGHLKGDPRLG